MENYRMRMNFNNGIGDNDAARAEAKDRSIDIVSASLNNVIPGNWQNLDGAWVDGNRVDVTFETTNVLTDNQRLNITNRSTKPAENIVANNLIQL